MDCDGSILGSSRATYNLYKTVIIYFTYLIFLLVNKIFIIKLFILMFFFYIERFYINIFFIITYVCIFIYIFIFLLLSNILQFMVLVQYQKNTRLMPQESVQENFMALITIFVLNFLIVVGQPISLGACQLGTQHGRGANRWLVC